MDNKNDSMRVVRRVISYFRALEEKSDPKEQEELWTRIRTDIGARDRRRRRLRLWSTVAAASLVGCMWLGYGLLSTGTSDLSQIAASMMGSISAEIDEIQLITEQGKAIKINDGSTVTYTPDGKIDLGDKQMRATPVTQEQYDRIVVPKGRFSRLVLADGSSLYINSNTQVVYPKQFEKDKREIFVDGEIYIDVHPDPAVPFIVRTADFDVEVLGTAFDVKAYGGKGNGPRPHDIRHTFAVHCLNNWVLSGEDLTAALPVLSHYLGHNGLTGTQKYLQLTAQMYPDILTKLETKFGDLIPKVEVYNESL